MDKFILDEVEKHLLYQPSVETMESVFSRNKKVFLDVDSSGNILYLPLDQSGGASPSSIMPPIKTPINSRSGTDTTSSRSKGREARR